MAKGLLHAELEIRPLKRAADAVGAPAEKVANGAPDANGMLDCRRAHDGSLDVFYVGLT